MDKTLEIDLFSGQHRLGTLTVAPLPESDFVNCELFRTGAFSVLHPTFGRSNYCTKAFFANTTVGLVLIYEQGSLESVWMTWLEGIASQKGYDATEQDLLRDLKILIDRCTEEFRTLPSETTFNRCIFNFPWGSVSCNASLSIQAVGMSGRYIQCSD